MNAQDQMEYLMYLQDKTPERTFTNRNWNQRGVPPNQPFPMPDKARYNAENQINQPAPVSRQNKAAKNAYIDTFSGGRIDDEGREIAGRNFSRRGNEFIERTRNPNKIVTARGDSGQAINRLAPVGRLPAIAAGLGAAGGVSSVIGAKDLLDQVYQTKDPVAAYRNWLGMGNDYE